MLQFSFAQVPVSCPVPGPFEHTADTLQSRRLQWEYVAYALLRRYFLELGDAAYLWLDRRLRVRLPDESFASGFYLSLVAKNLFQFPLGTSYSMLYLGDVASRVHCAFTGASICIRKLWLFPPAPFGGAWLLHKFCASWPLKRTLRAATALLRTSPWRGTRARSPAPGCSHDTSHTHQTDESKGPYTMHACDCH